MTTTWSRSGVRRRREAVALEQAPVVLVEPPPGVRDEGTEAVAPSHGVRTRWFGDRVVGLQVPSTTRSPAA